VLLLFCLLLSFCQKANKKGKQKRFFLKTFMFEKKFPKQTLRKQTKGRNLGKAFLPSFEFSAKKWGRPF
jgi:hypothetical protein